MLQVMVANIRCAEIMEEQLRCLAEDQAWASLRQESEKGLVPNFGSRAGALLDSCITGRLLASVRSPGNCPALGDAPAVVSALRAALPQQQPGPAPAAQASAHTAVLNIFSKYACHSCWHWRGVSQPCHVYAGYEQEARYFEEGVRHVKQDELVERAQALLHGAFSQQLVHLRRNILQQLDADMVSRDPSETFAASAAR